MQESRPSNVSATRRFQFCAGHRVYKHESKCAHPHGHNYVLFATFQPIESDLDAIGRVIDFSMIKNILGEWIDKKWDHGFIYYHHDEEMLKIMHENWSWKTYKMSTNPTAENMALHLLHEVCPVLFANLGVSCTEITLWETENCYATARL